MKDENSDMCVDSHGIVTRWNNYFSMLLNIHVADKLREPILLVSGPSFNKSQSIIGNCKYCVFPGISLIPTELT
jgi:hypothetical protein